jgi:hypothetical protein
MTVGTDTFSAMPSKERKTHDNLEEQREAQEKSKLPYEWNQTLDHVEVNVPVPPGTRARQVRVSMKRSAIKVEVNDSVVVEVR